MYTDGFPGIVNISDLCAARPQVTGHGIGSRSRRAAGVSWSPEGARGKKKEMGWEEETANEGLKRASIRSGAAFDAQSPLGARTSKKREHATPSRSRVNRIGG